MGMAEVQNEAKGKAKDKAGRKQKRQPGIMSFFLPLSAALFLMAMTVTGVMAYGLQVQKRLQEQFVRRTVGSDLVLADLYEMEKVFLEFGRNWTEEGYQAYRETCERLGDDLEELQALCAGEQVTQDDIRRLNNFNIYQQQLLERVMSQGEVPYKAYSYIINGLELHQQQAVEMAQNDMMYARSTYEAAYETISGRMSFAVVIFAAGVLSVGVMLAHFSAATRASLYRMTEYFNRLAAREWDSPNLEASRYWEFTLIAETANRMKQEIRNYVKDIQRQAKLEKELQEERLINEKQRAMMSAAQLSALRAQVNPHFLFNSLHTIGVTALVGDSNTVMQMVEATGSILRYSLYHEDVMTELDEELEIVRQYLFLQKCRFHDAVRAEIHNELEGENIQIPTMSIQPIVENCFKHGFGKKKSLYIHIAVAWETDGIVSVCVTDDGVGFDPKTIGSEQSGGIGLQNIRKRLELLYGTGTEWMEIESELDTYSSVTLLIPQRGEGHAGIDC